MHAHLEMPDQVGFDGRDEKARQGTAGLVWGELIIRAGGRILPRVGGRGRILPAGDYFTVISWTGVLGRRTGWTGQDWALASLKGAVQRMSAAEAPKRAV